MHIELMLRKNNHIRFLASLTLLAFSFNAVAYSAASDLLIHSPKNSFAELPRSILQIPDHVGSLQQFESNGSEKRPLVILIQDAHANPEAQRNIKSLIEFFKNQNELSKNPRSFSVFTENATGILNSDNIRQLPEHPEIEQQVIDHLASLGELSGVELFALDTKEQVVGVEDEAMYLKNLDEYKSILNARSEIDAVLSKLELKLFRNANEFLNPELKKVVLERQARKNDRRDLLAYLKNFSRHVNQSLAIDLFNAKEQLDFPNLTRILHLSVVERSFNFDSAREEWQKFLKLVPSNEITRRTQVVIDEITNILATQPHPNSNAQPRLYLEWMVLLEKLTQRRLEDFPNLHKALTFLTLQSEIDAMGLFNELERLEMRVEEKLTQNENERNFLRRRDALKLVSKLVRGEIIKDELGQFDKQSAINTLNGFDSKLTALLTPWVELALSFYKGAQKREERLVQNVLSNSSFDKHSLAVLVAGGFHTQGIVDSLKKHQISCAVVSPKISQIVDVNLYRDVMLGKNANVDRNTIFRPLLLSSLGDLNIIRSGYRHVANRTPGLGDFASSPRSELRAIDPKLQKIFSRIRQAFENTHHHPISDKMILEGTAALFGIDNPNDDERHATAKRILINVVAKSRGELNFDNFIRGFGDVTWHSTGKHRFMPLALAVINLFRGRDIFSPDLIPELIRIDPDFSYLTETHGLYANPNGIENGWLSTRLPSLTIPTPRGRKFIWLDVGTAPKTGGSPSLRILQQSVQSLVHGKEFVFLGSDRLFPIYEFDEGGFFASDTARLSKFQPDQFNNLQEVELDGITYLDARDSRNDVMSDDFMKDSPSALDFVSLSMALHHMRRPDEKVKELSLSSSAPPRKFEWYNERSDRIQTPRYFLTESQRKVIWNLMGHLSVGGILFLNLPWGAEYKSNRNLDLFLIIQRKDVNKFILYSQAIPFRPTRRTFASEEYLAVGYDRDFLSEIYDNRGIFSLYPKQANGFYEQIRVWLRRADLLTYRYQSLNNSVWARITDAIEVIRERGTLKEIFTTYLAGVPDSEPLKNKILRGVEELQKKAESARSELRASRTWRKTKRWIQQKGIFSLFLLGSTIAVSWYGYYYWKISQDPLVQAQKAMQNAKGVSLPLKHNSIIFRDSTDEHFLANPFMQESIHEALAHLRVTDGVTYSDIVSVEFAPGENVSRAEEYPYVVRLKMKGQEPAEVKFVDLRRGDDQLINNTQKVQVLVLGKQHANFVSKKTDLPKALYFLAFGTLGVLIAGILGEGFAKWRRNQLRARERAADVNRHSGERRHALGKAGRTSLGEDRNGKRSELRSNPIDLSTGQHENRTDFRSVRLSNPIDLSTGERESGKLRFANQKSELRQSRQIGTALANHATRASSELRFVQRAITLAGRFIPTNDFLDKHHPDLVNPQTGTREGLSGFLIRDAFASVREPAAIHSQVIRVVDAASGVNDNEFIPAFETMIRSHTKLVILLTNSSKDLAVQLETRLRQQLEIAAKRLSQSGKDRSAQLLVRSVSGSQENITTLVMNSYLSEPELRGKSAVISNDSAILERVRSGLRLSNDIDLTPTVQADALIRVIQSLGNLSAIPERFGVMALSKLLGRLSIDRARDQRTQVSA